jgi:hypothetical protein
VRFFPSAHRRRLLAAAPVVALTVGVFAVPSLADDALPVMDVPPDPEAPHAADASADTAATPAEHSPTIVPPSGYAEEITAAAEAAAAAAAAAAFCHVQDGRWHVHYACSLPFWLPPSFCNSSSCLIPLCRTFFCFIRTPQSQLGWALGTMQFA